MNQLLFGFKYLQFLFFQTHVHQDTWLKHDLIAQRANAELAESFEKLQVRLKKSSDPLVRQDLALRGALFTRFKNKHAQTSLRILIHRPPFTLSPGGYSLFNNLVEALQFEGVFTRIIDWDLPIKTQLRKYKPNVLLTSDSSYFLNKIDWTDVKDYRHKHELLLGLTASLEEYGNTPLAGRLSWAVAHQVDFFYSFRSREYLQTRPQYQAFYRSGFKILDVEFGANPLVFQVLPQVEKDLDYVFFASSNTDKWSQYFAYLPGIVKKHPGLIDGPGWFKLKNLIPLPAQKFVYARAKIGLNLHISDSLDWPAELNERTYILAACGVPQLVDNALLLNHRFAKNSLYVAKTPTEYVELFEYILSHPKQAQNRALKAHQTVMTQHTTFHRADHFIKQLEKLI